MRVWLLAYRADSLTFTIARALTVGGHEVAVWIVDSARDQKMAGGIRKSLQETPGVSIVAADESALPEAIDRLILQVFPRPRDSIANVGPLAGRARRITLVSAGDRSLARRIALAQQWFELRMMWRYLQRVDRVVYKDGFHNRDLLGLLRPRHVLGFDVHSQFIHYPELARAMHAQDWSVAATRPILANFLGNQDPEVRKRILDEVRPFFPAADHPGEAPAGGKAMFWHEYTRAAPIGVPPDEFVRILARSDFTLCPRGYSLVTHRPLEAMLRGSIPVLAESETDLYGFDLVDSENCIAVPKGGWADAMRRLAAYPEAEIVRMRRNIHGMFEAHLCYESVARGIRTRLGIEEPQ